MCNFEDSTFNEIIMSVSTMRCLQKYTPCIISNTCTNLKMKVYFKLKQRWILVICESIALFTFVTKRIGYVL